MAARNSELLPHRDDALRLAALDEVRRASASDALAVDDVRNASPTAATGYAHPLPPRENVHLLSPRLLRALRNLIVHHANAHALAPAAADSDDSLQGDYLEVGGASAVGRDSSGGNASVAVVNCQICFDDVPVSDAFQLTTCAHRFCYSCFSRFLTLKINEGQVHNLACFYELDGGATVCGAAIDRDDVQRLVSAKILDKFERFRFNQQHTFARQCPHCDCSQVCAGPEHPQCECESCARPFCFTHGIAHDASVTCTQYDKQQLRMEKRNRRKIRRISKPCPMCQTPVEKNGGCNHMRCLNCSADFCWLCGEKVSELVSDHYDWTNIRGCAGQQMVHVHGLTTTNKCLLYTARAAYYAFVYPIAFVLTLLVMLLSCGFAFCTLKRDLTFGQVFRWAFRVIAISGYTAIEFAAVTIVTGLAAGVFGVCWVFLELYKLGKKSVQQCSAWRRRKCPLSCSAPCSSRAKRQQQVDVVTSPQVLVCEYTRA